MSDVNLSEIIAPSFYSVHCAIKNDRFTHYVKKGGRGSTKSSFAAIEIILGIMKNPGTHGIAVRRVGNTLKDSVYARLKWAIAKLKVSRYWKIYKNPLELVYKPTGQRIMFWGSDGSDDADKLKSITLEEGYFKYIWLEEFSEFYGEEEVRKILQSLMRGGERFTVLYTYNPPKSVNNWVNAWARNALQRSDTLVHHSDYQAVPRDWLGEPFYIEAERLKESKPLAYRHEYLGEETGTGGQVFDNIEIRTITDAEIENFDRTRRGLDFGFACDPDCYGASYYSGGRLYIFFELWKHGLLINQLGDLIKAENVRNECVRADSEDPRSIADLRDQGVNVIQAKKGPGSVERGMKWLQRLEKIIIDDRRCPNTAREFLGYEYPQDRNGNFRSDYPDKNNHSIDRERYTNEELIGLSTVPRCRQV